MAARAGETCVCCEDLGGIPSYGACPLCEGLGFAKWAALLGPAAAHKTNEQPWNSAAASALASAGDLLPDPTAVGCSEVLPEAGKRNLLITAALPYVNNVPHLGNIIGSVLSGDVYARYCRSRGYQTLFVGGTDEYGTATEARALEEGLTPREICDKYHAVHADIYTWFNIAFDHFGRTSTPLQTEVVQSVFQRVRANGWLREEATQQLFSEKLGKFLADRFVEGTCPKCGYSDARGDQCDRCQTLLNPTELLAPRCKQTGTTPVLRPTRHLYLDLPSLESRVRDFVEGASVRHRWSENARHVTDAWLRDGLKPRCITRDLRWGVPVPHPGFEEKVFYVWFDAPIGYVSITAAYTKQWRRWWQAPGEVELAQFLGKDNIPFHTVIFPASLLATGDPWTLLHRASVTEYLNYEDGKFSKSRKIGVFGNDARDTGIHADVFRYYLLSVRPEQSDSEFRWSDLAARNNSELLKNLGNFCHRVLDFLGRKLAGKVPAAAADGRGVQECVVFGGELQALVATYIEHLERARLREGLKVALAVSSLGNAFLTRCEPWKLLASDPGSACTHLAAAAGVVRLLAALLAPFVPTVAGVLLQFLGLEADQGRLSDELLASIGRPHALLPAGHVLGPRSRPLFSELGPAQVDALRARFSGTPIAKGQTQTAGRSSARGS